ncbi:DUF4962 domain-containing protein [Pyrinomonas methylaliphatogenes]|uniref:Heparinase II/III-like protein n=1 Tax=Pyrinomonas methylaliphatogenes TaxID=454194 RepID=A0A0B6WVL2_9BACT|nr:DUF4962 domain-containing protein [Pyrinomonas methylaliphatogenes]CDM64324.1 Heparinase II/III-like protein [Pyrinomonas methylaliphatogenes]
MVRDLIALLVISFLLFSSRSFPQDRYETLGPKDNPARASRRPHPLEELMRTRHATLRPELRGVHPRVFVTEEELELLRQRARTTHRELWQRALSQVRALRRDPPPAPAQERRAQNEVGIGIAEAAFAYRIEGDPRLLAAARKYMEAAVSYDVWGYYYNKPNVDLAAGHLLYGLGWGYDLLYHDLTEKERARYRDKLIKQARLLFDYYKPKPGRTYSYSQNHVFIPIAGLAVAAYALYDEVEDAPEWARLARAIYDRVLATYTPDGYYYEGFEYWVFATPWIIHYLDAHRHATGEDLYDQPGLRAMHKYVAHTMLPSGRDIFDFGDAFEGPLTRLRRGEDHQRTHPGGHLLSNYNLLYATAARFRDGEAQGVAEWLRKLGQLNAEDFWSLIWYDPTVQPVPIEKQARWHYFTDHEVIYWRSGWSKEAVAFAFKCGPPEGHHAAELLKRFSDWHLSSGHAHPDAGSFIIYAKGRYLTGDSGYAGVPLTAHHNTALVDGRGQAREGRGHDAFSGVPYDLLNRIRILEAKLGDKEVVIRADVTSAYMPELDLLRFEREFRFSAEGGFRIIDTLQLAKAHVITELIHADETIMPLGDDRFAIGGSDAKLIVSVEEPKTVRFRIEPNIVIAAGLPGSVDKGERQERGQRLAISSAGPVRDIRFALSLKL